MLSKLTKAIRRWIEKRNNRPRILYADRSIFSKIILYLFFICATGIGFLGSIGWVEFELGTSGLLYVTLFLLAKLTMVFLFLFIWILLEFFDLSFDDFLSAIVVNCLFSFVSNIIHNYINNGIFVVIFALWHIAMFFYIYPTKFLRVYSDYSIENDILDR